MDLRESYEALFQVQVNQKLTESVRENYRNQLRYWSDMDLFQYHVNEEKINLEIGSLQNKAAEIEAKGGDQQNVLEEICLQMDTL